MSRDTEHDPKPKEYSDETGRNQETAKLREKREEMLKHSAGVIPPVPPPPSVADLVKAAGGGGGHHMQHALEQLVDVERLYGSAFRWIARCKKCGWQTMQQDPELGRKGVMQHAQAHWAEIQAMISLAEDTSTEPSKLPVLEKLPQEKHGERSTRRKYNRDPRPEDEWRDAVSFCALIQGLEGEEYCKFLSQNQVHTPTNWWKKAGKEYPEAFKKPAYKKRIYQQKNRASKKLERLKRENPKALDKILRGHQVS